MKTEYLIVGIVALVAVVALFFVNGNGAGDISKAPQKIDNVLISTLQQNCNDISLDKVFVGDCLMLGNNLKKLDPFLNNYLRLESVEVQGEEGRAVFSTIDGTESLFSAVFKGGDDDYIECGSIEPPASGSGPSGDVKPKMPKTGFAVAGCTLVCVDGCEGSFVYNNKKISFLAYPDEEMVKITGKVDLTTQT